MLTDVFVNRYEDTRIWTSFGDREKRFMVQAAKIITEQVFPYYVNGNEDKSAKKTLQSLHDKIAMEIGIDPLSPLYIGTYRYPIVDVVKNFFTEDFEPTLDADVFIKRRVSFVELAFREYEDQKNGENADLARRITAVQGDEQLPQLARTLRLPIFTEDYIRDQNSARNDSFNQNTTELNERFRQARFPLSYRNGFIQFSEDSVISAIIEKPFWSIVSDPKWKNVEHDLLEAIDRRDNKRKDAALSAAKALESAIKIISDEKGWTTKKEKGAASYIDNLVSEKNGRFIDVWESNMLKSFFSEIRNNLGHGPGAAPMLELNEQQNSWAIQTCMSWINSLIART